MLQKEYERIYDLNFIKGIINEKHINPSSKKNMYELEPISERINATANNVVGNTRNEPNLAVTSKKLAEDFAILSTPNMTATMSPMYITKIKNGFKTTSKKPTVI